MNKSGPRLLVVDDEPAVRRFLQIALSAQSYVVFEASCGREALSGAVAHKPDVVILDLGLPDIDGVEVTRLLREWTQIPIIVLSVRQSEKDKINALDAGADDYLTKPFGIGELTARLRVALRRTVPNASEAVFVNGELTVDLAKRLVTLAGQEKQLTPTEYSLLRTLVVNSGKVLTHRQLLRQVWGVGYEQELHMLHVNISNLRHKLEPDSTRPQYIVTEPGVGYRLRTAS